ncbi:ATP-binding cassette domain-containing protein [Pendulispora brunnea]|uniref:ATP-binding cassette domain-containing protein n=1 Tax=Pendulispora brunnea TaxID=2905690 RepID=A0ABZ2K6U9_9BACT
MGPVRRRFLAPQVIQTSSIDCGPACLTSAFAGYGLDVGYESLRDACQTDVDGTSIDALERVANHLGLVAEQIWVPVDHLTIAEIAPLPAIIVAQKPGGPAHFLLAWRQHLGLFQVMDPAMGRRWVSGTQLASMNFPYEIDIDGEIWRDWASTPEFSHAMHLRLAHVRGDKTLLEAANADPSPISLATLDAATRMVADLVVAGAVRRGHESRDLLASLYAQALVDHAAGASGRSIPELFFSALPLPGGQVRLRGAIVLRFRGRRADGATSTSPEDPLVSETVLRIKKEPRRRPWLEAIRILERDGLLTPTIIGGATLVSAFIAFIEIIMLRALLDIGGRLQGTGQRLVSIALLVGFMLFATTFELWSAVAVRALGRRFELRLRTDFLSKIPRLGDAYFRSRPASDMAHRAHSFYPVRNVPWLAARILRLLTTLAVTLVGLLWLDPAGWHIALGTAATCVVIPWIGQSLLTEKDLNVRVQNGRLAQFNLDALLGLMPIRAHGAERAVRWEHASIVFEWAGACKERLRLTLTIESLQTLATTLLSILVVLGYMRRTAEPGAILLLAYWVLGLPAVGQELALLVRQLPRQHNLLGRLLEPILSEDTESCAASPDLETIHSTAQAPRIRFDDVSVVIGGRTVLDAISLDVAAGEHVAIVGPSGAGKSTLLGLLLGFCGNGAGIRIDDRPLDVKELRKRVVWVDPAVTLWSQPLVDNVRFGTEDREDLPIAPILRQAELLEVLESMPDGLQTNLGEAGRLVSGGEGQRVRLARGMSKAAAGLVLLDEPFRGLERPMREQLARRARNWWTGATLLCVTHDIAEAMNFDRVVVVDDGRIVEQGSPSELLETKGGRFYELLDSERELHEKRWNDPAWRNLHVKQGLIEGRVAGSAANEP